MNRKEILEEINKILIRENAKAINENNLLTDSELDSFGYAMLFIELDDNHNCFSKEYVQSIDFPQYKAKDLIDRILGKTKSKKCIKKRKKYKNRSKKCS